MLQILKLEAAENFICNLSSDSHIKIILKHISSNISIEDNIQDFCPKSQKFQNSCYNCHAENIPTKIRNVLNERTFFQRKPSKCSICVAAKRVRNKSKTTQTIPGPCDEKHAPGAQHYFGVPFSAVILAFRVAFVPP